MRFVFLSDEFYNDYAGCSEIMQKRDRPYACLAVKIQGHVFAIPFRHHIAHKYCFHTYSDYGIDYTKAVLISKPSYIGTGKPQIDQREFNALKGKDAQIAREFEKYFKLYKKALHYPNSPYYQNIVRYSTLKYFKL